MNPKKIVFVTGLPRSMTTLMCNMLAANPRIGGGETSPLLEYIYSARDNFSYTPEVASMLDKDTVTKAFKEFCYWGMMGYANAVTSKDILIDKSRGYVHYQPFVSEIIPDAKYILVVRDLKSIVASLESKWRANQLIRDKRDSPQNMSFITLEQRVTHFLSEAPLGLALYRLGNAIDTGTIKNFLVVKAEDLTARPLETMKKVYEHIGEEYYDLDYFNVPQSTIENDRIHDYGIYGDHKIRSSVEPLTDNTTKILTPNLCNKITREFEWFYTYFHYKK